MGNSGVAELPKFARVSGGFVIAVGSLVFAGWALGIQRLIRLVPSLVAMNPVTAIVFICAGVALWRLAKLEAGSGQGRDPLVSALGGLVAVAGGLRLLDYLFQTGLNLEQLLFPGRVGAVGVYPPSEMAPNTAFGFLLCGAALLLLDGKDRRWVQLGQGMILACGLVVLLALIGYTYRILFFYRVGLAFPMAFETALAFAVLCLGCLAARPEQGVMTVLTSQTTGGWVARRLLPVAILVPWLLGAFLLLGEQAGFYEREHALSMFTVASILIFTVLIGCNARLLYEADLKRNRAEVQLRQTTANLQRSNNDLQQFANVASHDLFEPLRMVISYLQLLSLQYRGQLEPPAQEFIGYAVDGAERMQALIQDLLAYSRVDVRGAAFEPTDCEQVFQAAVANLKVPIEETAATVTHEPLPKVMADRVQLTQVFQNLIGNALKFHGAEPPRVEISVGRRAQEWLFSVRDNGIGIESAQFERIFIIFQRLHTRQEYAGTGMGLAICRKIIERHGGRIWVESKPGKGATFLFTLPAAMKESEIRNPKSETNSQADNQSFKTPRSRGF